MFKLLTKLDKALREYDWYTHFYLGSDWRLEVKGYKTEDCGCCTMSVTKTVRVEEGDTLETLLSKVDGAI